MCSMEEVKKKIKAKEGRERARESERARGRKDDVERKTGRHHVAVSPQHVLPLRVRTRCPVPGRQIICYYEVYI